MALIDTKHQTSFQIPRMDSEAYQQLLQQCVHCGLCLEACPTYAVFGTEMDGPRGRIALMRAAAEERISREAFLSTFAEHITLCLECRACESACPSGVQYGKLVEGARVALEDIREPGGPERLLRWLGMHQLMPNLDWLKAMARVMWLYETSGLQWLVRTVNILPKTLASMESILPPIPTRYFNYDQPAPAIGKTRGKIAFFYGCIQEAFLGQINAATIRVLQRNGYEVHFPQEQTCCGAAQWHTGDEDLAQQLARQNIDAFLAGDYDAIVNNAGGCGLTLQEYPDLLHDDPAYVEKARQFSAKVQDFSAFLAEHLHELPQGELPVRATYVDSCHLRHGQKVIDQPRDLLGKIPGLTLVELKHPDRCCGSAGVYNIAQPDTANAVLEAKIADIVATGADLVVTSNTGCHMQLRAGVRRARLNVKVMHIAEVLDLAYRVEERWTLRKERHPRPLFGYPKLPERWLAWQAQRRDGNGQDGPLASLKALLEPGQVTDNPVELLTYELDAGLDAGLPVGVAFPYTTSDVQTLIHWAAEHNVPVVARGAGTGLSGGAIAERGGIIVVFSHMQEMITFDRLGRSAVVQPGLVNLKLDERVKTENLYFPPDPASGRTSTLGGNIGFNAGGPHCFKYGVTTNYVTGLEVVLADGQCLHFGGRAFDYPEIDVTGLMVGSEGTLGIATEASISLRRNPPAVKTMMAAFDSVEQAGEAVSAVISGGLTPATMEMMDQRMMRIIEDFVSAGLPVDAGAALIIEADGYPDSVSPQIEEFAVVLREHGARDLRIAQTEAERTKIWYGRKSAVGALARVAPAYYIVDGTVPRSRLAYALGEVNRICDELDLPVGYVFHAGDGNLHPLILISDPDDQALLDRVHKAGRLVSTLCVEAGGSITGEHGVGIEKRDFMPLMYTADELNAMREIKSLFDPQGLLNPGKIFPQKVSPADMPDLASAPVPAAVPDASTYAPSTVQAAAEAIRAWASAGQPIRVRGGGTKSALFPETGVLLSTKELCTIKTYTLDDLYVTVGAGLPLATLQGELARDGMWVPLASPWQESTVGGLLATNFNAPLRMRYGAIRDLVLALTAILPDGRIIRAGRPVMKNVAGYDLTKLFIGAYGSLGLIADVTLKLAPRPRARATYAVPMDNLHRALACGQRLLRVALVASSVLLCHKHECEIPGLDTRAPFVLLYTAEGLPEDVAAEMLQVREALEDLAAPLPVALDAAGSDIWATWIRGGDPNMTSASLLRVGVPPKDVRGFVVHSLASGLAQTAFIADFASGLLYVRGGDDVTALRQASQERGGYTVMLEAPRRDPSGNASIDLWGYTPEGLDMMRALKARWDTKNIFNPGTFIV